MEEFNQELSAFQKAIKIVDPWYVIGYELN